MTTTITCLLVTNDPDDFLEFSEALNEISKDAILIAVADTVKALTLLTDILQSPDYIFLNVAMYGGKPADFLRHLKNSEEFSDIPIVAYGDSMNIDGLKSAASFFLSGDFSYAELKLFLTGLLNSSSR